MPLFWAISNGLNAATNHVRINSIYNVCLGNKQKLNQARNGDVRIAQFAGFVSGKGKMISLHVESALENSIEVV